MSEKLTIADETGAIDYRAKDLWDTLTEEQRKQISFYFITLKNSNSKSKIARFVVPPINSF